MRTSVALTLLLALAACRSGKSEPSKPIEPSHPTGGTITSASSVGDEWTIAPGDYASTRFSTLSDINTANVGQLREAWSFATGTLGGHEGAPLVVGHTMFVVTPFPNILYALDLTKPGGSVKWRYDPDPQGAAKGVACCDTVNRGAAYANGRVFIN